MAVNFTMRYTDRVRVLPKATLKDGSTVSDYAQAMVVDLHGVSYCFAACMDQYGTEEAPHGVCLINKYAVWPTL